MKINMKDSKVEFSDDCSMMFKIIFRIFFWLLRTLTRMQAWCKKRIDKQNGR